MKTSIFLLPVFVLLFLYQVEVATLVLRPSEIDRSVVIKAPYALTTKSHLELFSPEHLAMKILLFSEAFTVNISLLKGQCGRV